MSFLAPGLSVLFRFIVINVLIGGGLYQAQALAARHLGTSLVLALWQIALASPFLVVASVIIGQYLKIFARRLEMKRMGGAAMPVIKGARWANLDLVPKIMEHRAKGYPGNPFDRLRRTT